MNLIGKRLEGALVSGLRRLPLVSFYAGTRGWYFVLSWCHRITGMLLVLMALWHILLFRAASGPSSFFLPALFLWLLSLPVIFHAFNGARLIQFECYGRRDDENMIRWVFGLLLVFVSLLALFMITGGQRESPFFYWVLVTAGALVTSYAVGARIRNTRHSFFWKWQRLSGAFLLVMVPAYVLFIQIQPGANLGADNMTKGMHSFALKGVYLLLLSATLFHGGYGLWTVVRDYVSLRSLRKMLAVAVSIFFLISFRIGVKGIIGF